MMPLAQRNDPFSSVQFDAAAIQNEEILMVHHVTPDLPLILTYSVKDQRHNLWTFHHRHTAGWNSKEFAKSPRKKTPVKKSEIAVALHQMMVRESDNHKVALDVTVDRQFHSELCLTGIWSSERYVEIIIEYKYF